MAESRRIDVHAHWTPIEYLQFLRQAGADRELPVFRALPGLVAALDAPAPPDTEAELARRVADMDEGGVAAQIISIGALQPYLRSERDAVAGARMLNDAYAGFAQQDPRRFAWFATLPLPHATAAVEELQRAAGLPGFRGVALGPSAAGIVLDDERFEPLWAQLAQRDGVVYIHPGVGIDGIAGCTDHHLAPDFVSPAELAVCAARLVVSGLLDRHPGVRFVLATLGGALPFLARRYDSGLLRSDPDRHQRLGGFEASLRRFWVDCSVTEEPAALAAAATTFGADRIVLGTDVPRPGVTSAGVVAYVRSAPGLTDEARTSILDRNASVLFGTVRR